MEEYTAVHDRVLAIFEQHRARPGSAFDEDNFLCYLLPERQLPSNSFAGLRRLNRFIDAVQLENAVCFSLKDREANYSLDAFVARVVELRRSRRSSQASLRNQERHGFGWHAVLIINLLAVSVCAVAIRYAAPLGWLLVAALLLVNINVVRLYARQRTYMKLLRSRIEGTHRDAA